MFIIQSTNENIFITDNNSLVFPSDKDLTANDVLVFIEQHKSIAKHYDDLRNDYLGKHEILTKETHRGDRPDNRLVANLAHYIVETFNGFFIGIPPKITLDDETNNEKLKQWNDTNSMQDKLSEVSRQVDIYGRSIVFIYQNEDSDTKVQYASPLSSFIIYDDSVEMNPVAFVNYYEVNNKLKGQIYTSDLIYELSDKFDMSDGTVNPFNEVPAIEFFENEDRQGVLDNVQTLIDALDNAMSQKANQNEYFDNAYLKVLGLNMEDEEGNVTLNLDGQQVIYSPDAEAANAEVGFIEKPDGDQMQENLLERIINLTYQISMVANLNDAAFSGNSSGVALEYKLLPMKNLAMNKERKFTQSLRQLYKLIFSIGTVLDSNGINEWQNIKMKFTRNLPVNLADEAKTAMTLEGIVSKETQLSTLSIVDDPQAEIKKMADEQTESINNAKAAAGNLTDEDKPDEE